MPVPDLTFIDDTERERFFWDRDGVMHRLHDSPLEDRIHRENRALAEHNRDLTFGRLVLRMSLAEYDMLKRLYPELRPGTDPRERRRRWLRIAHDLDYRAIQIGSA